jgi:hydroxypyruvate isomerase
VKVLFDIYHQQITEGNLIANLVQNVDLIGHIHIAGNPGRHEPHLNSEVHYPTVLAAVKNAGYRGYAGLEYFPTEDAEKGIREILEAMPL